MAIQSILDHIKKEASDKIKHIESEAEKSMQQIKEEFKAKKHQKKEEVEKNKQEKIEMLSRRTRLMADSELKKKALSEKRKLLEAIYEESLDHLVSSKEYESFETKLWEEASSQIEEGIVRPAKSKEAHLKKLIEKSGASYTLGEPVPEIKGGFIIEGKTMNIDASIESILGKELWGSLEIELNKLLFS